MKNHLIKFLTISCFSIFLIRSGAVAQTSGPEFRRSATHNANLVKTGFGNWGVIGQPAQRPRGAWIHENNGYIGDVSPMVGAEVFLNSLLFHSVVVTPVARPTQNREESASGQFWGFEPDGRYFNNNQQLVAMSDNPDSWPPFWPDKLNDPEDPGWRGAWNGFFGKNVFNADQESYFVMDDDNDREFNFAENNNLAISFKPDSTNLSRNGLGLAVKVRGLQWAQFLAQDTIFWLYEIINQSTSHYSRTVFGMLVGTFVGATFNRASGNEFDDDYSFFDVELDMTFTADFDDNVGRNPDWVGSDVGVVAYAFLESPGNAFDGIDNDGDADESLIPTGPFFTETDFEPRRINAGDKVVIIDEDFNRRVVTVPATDTVFVTRGSGAGENKITVIPGITELVEGNTIVVNGRQTSNPNATDGIDNDLDGLIDENFQLHFRQIRRDTQGNVLINLLRPMKHVDYITGDGMNNPLIDEKRNDGIDNDNDWDPEFDDVGRDGMADTNDMGENDNVPTAGEPNFDQTDVSESDQIGLTSFEYFVPANNIDLADDEELWGRMSPGLFDVPRSIQNNRPVNGEDGDFIYGSGYFPLLAGQTERFSLALVYGDGGGRNVLIDDLLKNRITVQKIFDADYRFPKPPEKPTLTAVPGDGKVTLYWDRKSESSLDPVLRVRDFEGYKLYKATDPRFLDAFEITDALGSVQKFKPIQQYDLDNDIQGFFLPSEELIEATSGLSFFLGSNTGLQHSFVDTDVDNGRTYFYALTAYDRGDASADIFPSENPIRIDQAPSGKFSTDINTVIVVPNAPVAGFEPPENSIRLDKISAIGTGEIFFEVIDQQVQTGHHYQLEFLDTANDGIDNDGDWNIALHDVGSDGVPGTEDADGSEGNGRPDAGEPNVDALDNEERLVPLTHFYSIKDNTGVIEDFTAKDTLFVNLKNENLIAETVEVRETDGSLVSPDKYILDAENGKIRGINPGDLAENDFSITYKYYPIFKSPNIQRSPFAPETRDTDIFDGIQLLFNNTSTRSGIKLDDANSGFNTETFLQFTFQSDFNTIVGGKTIRLLPHPADYEIRFFDTIVDTSRPPAPILPGVPVNFEIWNTTEQKKIEFLFTDLDRNNTISPTDRLRFFEEGVAGEKVRTWDMFFPALNQGETFTPFAAGVVLTLKTFKPFRKGDTFEFTTVVASVNPESAQQNQEMEKIKVVPNPYIVGTPFELPPPPGVSGRGERKIDFIHLPDDAAVHIFTSRGEHVITLRHDGNIHDGAVSWNLKTKENLNIAFGMYFYVVESRLGTKRGKIAIIK
ncbi:MAG: hypothetical protein ACE5HS_07540 [bacterium]